MIELKVLAPTQTGGGRPRGRLKAKLYKHGQLIFNQAVFEHLGEPKRVKVEAHVLNGIPLDLVLTKAGENDYEGWSVSGGNSIHTFSMRHFKDLLLPIAGELDVEFTDEGVILRTKP